MYPLRDEPIIVALIAGVDPQGNANYSADLTTAFGQKFGSGPGCAGTVRVEDELDPNDPTQTVPGFLETAQAVPPVRLRRFAEHFASDESDQYMFSVCDADYSPALFGIAEEISRQIEPACLRGCALNTEPGAVVVVPSCQVTREYHDQIETMRECKHDTEMIGGVEIRVYDWDEASGYQMPDDDADSCYAILVDDGPASGEAPHTDSPADDLDEKCYEQGFNVEFFVQRRPGFEAQPGEAIVASCTMASNAALECGV